MKRKIPTSPFSTRLSGSARETELRIRNIFQWKKKRPPVVLFILTAVLLFACFGLVSFRMKTEQSSMDGSIPSADASIVENTDNMERLTDTLPENTAAPPKADDAGSHSDLGLPDVIELSASDGKTYPARRYDGDGWYLYIPISDWYQYDVWDRWESQYGTGAYLSVQPCTDGMEDIKGYYGTLGAWPYDTDMESPYDYYYLLTPLARETVRQELFFVPVSEAFSYVLTCTWVTDTQREGEYELLHAMAASFTVDERVSRAPTEEDAEPDATQEVLDHVDAVFDSEEYVALQCWLLPGTGPVMVDMKDYYAQVREVFARYTWTLEGGEEPEREVTLDHWTLYLNSYLDGAGVYNIVAGSSSNWIKVYVPASEGSTIINFSYNGEPGSLNDALAALWGAPDIRHAQVLLPEAIEGDQALAEAYEEAFRELYLNSASITEYELKKLEVLPHDGFPSFRMTYAVKPTDPTAPCWKHDPVGEDGWITFSVLIHLTKAGYEHIEESVWRCSWYQSVD